MFAEPFFILGTFLDIFRCVGYGWNGGVGGDVIVVGGYGFVALCIVRLCHISRSRDWGEGLLVAACLKVAAYCCR